MVRTNGVILQPVPNLIRRMEQGEAFAMTCPLMTKADGGKFGKSESGTIWLSPEKTSPYKFYQFWLNTADADASKYIRTFSLLSKEEIEALEKEQAEAPHLRTLQKALAKDITVRVHSEEDYEKAVQASEILFSKKATDTLKLIDEQTLLDVFEGVPQIEVNKAELLSAETVLDLLTDKANGEIFPSKGEAKRSIKGGAISINKEKVISEEDTPTFELLQDKYLLGTKRQKELLFTEIHIVMKYRFLLLALIGFTVFTSCRKKEEDNKTVENTGTIENGTFTPEEEAPYIPLKVGMNGFIMKTKTT